MANKTLKKKAWNVFSQYIRLKYADSSGYCTCVTCGVKKYWEKDGMQAGHLIDSRCNSVLFNEEVVFPQCYSCNVGKKGNKIAYVFYAKEVLGYSDEKLKELYNLKHKASKLSDHELTGWMEEWQEYIDDWKVGKDIREGSI